MNTNVLVEHISVEAHFRAHHIKSRLGPSHIVHVGLLARLASKENRTKFGSVWENVNRAISSGRCAKVVFS